MELVCNETDVAEIELEVTRNDMHNSTSLLSDQQIGMLSV